MLKKIYQTILQLPSYITPEFVKKRIDTERWSVDQFMSRNIPLYVREGSAVLDAGAGPHRYRTLIKSAGGKYHATDFEHVFSKGSPDSYDFVCSLDDIPQPDNSYDIIVNTQVLEHVEYPQRVINELYRILKPGGKLLLTTNQMFWLHHSPYNFFFFTKFGLASLFTHAGFTINSIESRGGALWFLAKLCTYLPSHLYYQLVYTAHKSDKSVLITMKRPILALLVLPFYLLAKILIEILLPFILFYFDRFDSHKEITLGHECVCTKPL